jgi:hypothetical protein
VGDIRALLTARHANPAAVSQELARHIDSITLLPEGKGNLIRYKGNWKLLGDRECAEGAVRSIVDMSEISVPFEGVFRRAA